MTEFTRIDLDRGTVPPCRTCGRSKTPHRYGWCPACYMRWRRAGQPHDEEALTPLREVQRDRRDDYFELRRWGETREQAARRAGVSPQTARGYDRQLREMRRT